MAQKLSLAQLRNDASNNVRTDIPASTFVSWINEMLGLISEVAQEEGTATFTDVSKDSQGQFSFTLPDDYMKALKVEISVNGVLYKADERGFSDNEMTTENQYPRTSRNVRANPFYWFKKGNEIIVKGSLNASVIDINFYYFATLPFFDDSNGDISNNLENYTLPIEGNYSSLGSYYASFKYYEGWGSDSDRQYFLGLYQSRLADFESSRQREVNRLEESTQIVEVRLR